MRILSRVAKSRDQEPASSARPASPEKAVQAEASRIFETLDRSQAIIEFALDGTILTANHNFLRVTGYDLNEIQGRHHRMFVSHADAESSAYLQFWARLGRGEFDAGQYERIAKNGNRIWLLATYNPVLDDQGRPVKVIKFATDVTAARVEQARNEGQLEALDKSQGVIEFSTAGEVLGANENFLKMLGYRLDEIIGRHHRIFVDPAYANSPAYGQFWDRLGRGIYDSGQYRRISRDGRQVWIQASYNPVLDINGKPFKIVKYVTSDITDQVNMVTRLRQIADVVASAASEMHQTAEAVAGTASESTRQASAVSGASAEASMNVQTVAAASEELASSVGEIGRQIEDSRNIAGRAVTESEQANQAFSVLSASVGRIGDIMKLIRDIAGQTNLLALNATIEAARAGQAGRGFAVVASEVKALSNQTAKATEDIGAQISAMQTATTNSLDAMKNVGWTIGKSAEITTMIASAIEEQRAATGEISRSAAAAARGTEQVSENIVGVSSAAAEARGQSDSLLSAADRLAQQATTMRSEVNSYLDRIGA